MSKLGKLVEPLYYKVFPHWSSILKKELDGYNTALDLGCGYDSPIKYCNIRHKVGVDIYEPYIQHSKEEKIHHAYIQHDIRSVNLPFSPKTYDAVLALAVLEHMDREEGYNLIRNMERIATKKVVISVPNGWIPLDELDNNPYMVHKSAWEVSDFINRKYRVYGTHGWKNLRGYRGWYKGSKRIPEFCKSLFSDMTQWVTIYEPEWAFVLLAVLDVHEKDTKLEMAVS